VFTKILVPLDAAQESESALALATALASRFGDAVELLAVISDPGDLNPVKSEYDALLLESAERRSGYARAYLDAVRAKTPTTECLISTTVRRGPVAETIVSTAGADGAGLIAMATHGRVGPERWFLGSIADKVLRTSPIPVLLVRPPIPSPVHSLTDILVPLDGSPLAERALPTAAALAHALGVPMTLIRALPSGWWNSGTGPEFGGGADLTPALMDQLENDARDYLEARAISLVSQQLDVRTQFGLFCPADAMVEEVAAACSSPLVVMTSHGRSGVGRMVLGSVTDRIVRSSSAPVLVIPAATP
jgi:nucleotide-binding universal stress UspA family protein